MLQSSQISLYNVRCLQDRVSEWSWGAVPLSDSRHAGWAGLHSLLYWLPTVSCPSADINMHQTNPTLIHEKCYSILKLPLYILQCCVSWFCNDCSLKRCRCSSLQKEKNPQELQPLKLEILPITHLCFKISLLRSGEKCRNLSYCVLVAIKGIFHFLLKLSKYFPTEF